MNRFNGQGSLTSDIFRYFSVAVRKRELGRLGKVMAEES